MRQKGKSPGLSLSLYAPMNIYYPEYYKHFRCIASACQDSCCHEWEVDIDPETAAFYRALPGDLGDRLRQVLRDTEDGTSMTIEHGRCPMWRQDGLCRIQAELGHDALCHTCRTFPRLRHDYGNFAELGLELSCPEAARLILSGQRCSVCTETAAGDDSPDYDAEVMSTLLRSRNQIRLLLDDLAFTIPQLLTVLLLYAHEVQAEIDGSEPALMDPESALAAGRKYAKSADLQLFIDFFKSLEILTVRWKNRLDFPSPTPWSNEYRHLIRYFTDRYWLQAVSDFDLIGRAKLIVASCLLIRYLGGDLTETAQLFSKEIENSPDNVEAILDGAYCSPALTDLQLLSLLHS